MSSTTAKTIHLRELEPRDRHVLIFASFDALQAGESLPLVNDDIRDRFASLEDRTPGQFGLVLRGGRPHRAASADRQVGRRR